MRPLLNPLFQPALRGALSISSKTRGSLAAGACRRNAALRLDVSSHIYSKRKHTQALGTLAAHRRAFATRASAPSHYEVLGVNKGASPSEIKRAYLTGAKKWHPDVNKSPEAAQRFKELANAYHVLGDATRRAEYNTYGHQQHASGSQGYPGSQGSAQSNPSSAGSAQGNMGDVDPFELFRAVLQELGLEQIEQYWKNVKWEASSAAAKAREGNLQPARTFAQNHKTLFVGIVLPAALLLRFPWLVGMALRGVAAVGTLMLSNPAVRDTVGRLAWLRWRRLQEQASQRARSKQR